MASPSRSSGETLAIVGESGCGKSMTALSLMRLVPDPPGRIVGGTITLDGVDLLALEREAMRAVRGNDISMIFQEPMTSLNPVMTIGSQIAEASAAARKLSRKAGVEQGDRDAAAGAHSRAGAARAGISASAFGRHAPARDDRHGAGCNPKVLIADEPTTALDVTIQAQILDLMLDLQAKLGTAIVLITHDLGVVAETAQRVIVMYAGRKVEEAQVEELFARPLHPYTHGLMASIPRLTLLTGENEEPRRTLAGNPRHGAGADRLPTGCAFAPRCAHAEDRCREEYPPYEEKRPGHWAACWRSAELIGERDG